MRTACLNTAAAVGVPATRAYAFSPASVTLSVSTSMRPSPTSPRARSSANSAGRSSSNTIATITLSRRFAAKLAAIVKLASLPVEKPAGSITVLPLQLRTSSSRKPIPYWSSVCRIVAWLTECTPSSTHTAWLVPASLGIVRVNSEFSRADKAGDVEK
jgi:hypothetical protein